MYDFSCTVYFCTTRQDQNLALPEGDCYCCYTTRGLSVSERCSREGLCNPVLLLRCWWVFRTCALTYAHKTGRGWHRKAHTQFDTQAAEIYFSSHTATGENVLCQNRLPSREDFQYYFGAPKQWLIAQLCWDLPVGVADWSDMPYNALWHHRLAVLLHTRFAVHRSDKSTVFWDGM